MVPAGGRADPMRGLPHLLWEAAATSTASVVLYVKQNSNNRGVNYKQLEVLSLRHSNSLSPCLDLDLSTIPTQRHTTSCVAVKTAC